MFNVRMDLPYALCVLNWGGPLTRRQSSWHFEGLKIGPKKGQKNLLWSCTAHHAGLRLPFGSHRSHFNVGFHSHGSGGLC